MNRKVDWYIHLDRVQFYILQKAAICHCFCEINDVEKIMFYVFSTKLHEIMLQLYEIIGRSWTVTLHSCSIIKPNVY